MMENDYVTSNNVPSILWSLVNIETGERYADSAEEFVDTQEVAMKGRKDNLCGVPLFRYE